MNIPTIQLLTNGVNVCCARIVNSAYVKNELVMDIHNQLMLMSDSSSQYLFFTAIQWVFMTSSQDLAFK